MFSKEIAKTTSLIESFKLLLLAYCLRYGRVTYMRQVYEALERIIITPSASNEESHFHLILEHNSFTSTFSLVGHTTHLFL